MIQVILPFLQLFFLTITIFLIPLVDPVSYLLPIFFLLGWYWISILVFFFNPMQVFYPAFFHLQLTSQALAYYHYQQLNQLSNSISYFLRKHIILHLSIAPTIVANRPSFLCYIFYFSLVCMKMPWTNNTPYSSQLESNNR